MICSQALRKQPPANLTFVEPLESNDDSNKLYKRVHQRLNAYSQWETYRVPPPEDNGKYAFVVCIRRSHPNAVPPEETFLQIESKHLKNVLKDCLTNVAAVLDSTPLINTQRLFLQINAITTELRKREASMTEIDDVIPTNISDSSISDSEDSNIPVTPTESELHLEVLHLRALVEFLEEDSKEIKEKVDALLLKNNITYDLLWYLFPEGSEVSFHDVKSGLICAGKIVNAMYQLSPPMPGMLGGQGSGSNFVVTIRYIDYNGITFHYSVQPISIPQFRDAREIDSLPIQSLDPLLKQELHTRGQKFISLKGRHHLNYNGFIIQEGNTNLQDMLLVSEETIQHQLPEHPQDHSTKLHFQATGRVMVDCPSYFKMVPAARQNLFVPHPSLQLIDVLETELHFCAPTILGYSFAVKKWGRLAVDKFTEIQWNTEAFEHLVLSEEKKTLVKSIIYADQSGLITDLVTHKAGGFIVLLHGNPGTGKTLTAEAAAEKAQKPLMILSAAELGFRAIAVELNLRNILEICKLWDAILLIDEAEVILEERAPGDIQRNAMVSVLLRLLEYHQQVIFLTTNHITRIDPAVRSRIGVAIEYPDLGFDAREQIWARFLKMGGVEICEDHADGLNAIRRDELQKLAERKLNGRQIKNVVRIAQAVSGYKNGQLNYALMEDVLAMTKDSGESQGL